MSSPLARRWIATPAAMTVSITITAAKLLGEVLKPIISPPMNFRSNCFASNESGSQPRSRRICSLFSFQNFALSGTSTKR